MDFVEITLSQTQNIKNNLCGLHKTELLDLFRNQSPIVLTTLIYNYYVGLVLLYFRKILKLSTVQL